MATEPSHIADLLLRLQRGTLSETDRQELDAWVAASEENAQLYQELTDETAVRTGIREIAGFDETRVRGLILAQMPGAFAAQSPETLPPHIRLSARRRTFIRWSAAAAVIVLVGTGAWWFMTSRRTTVPVAQTAKPVDIAAPVRNRATLTLASGRQVALDSISSGELAIQGQTSIKKEANGQITYIATAGQPVAMLYNTLNNPRGSQVVTLTLTDGTRVWLNSESSIKYPAFFADGDRKVEITGEAYFEVARDATKPFKVMINQREEVDVLGTSFNVNAYEDEPSIKTTLLEGSVRVAVASGEKSSVVLKPGEQAQVNSGKGVLRVDKKADVDQAVAWKEGRFAFNGADVQTVMRQLARWYDVDVKYEGEIPKREFKGKIGKTLTLDQALKILTATRIHYTIALGRQLIVRP